MSDYVYFKNNFAMPFVLFLLQLINQGKCHHLWCHVNRNAVFFSQGGAGGLKVMECLECPGWKANIFTRKGIFFGCVERNAYSVYVVVNFLSSVIFIFPLFQLHLHTLPYPKTKEEQK